MKPVNEIAMVLYFLTDIVRLFLLKTTLDLDFKTTAQMIYVFKKTRLRQIFERMIKTKVTKEESQNTNILFFLVVNLMSKRITMRRRTLWMILKCSF